MLLHSVEVECSKVGLGMNAKKTKGMTFNVDFETIQNLNGKDVGQALTESGEQDFKYLGSWSDQNRDLQTRKALAWSVLNKMNKICKSVLPGWLKLRIVRAAVESTAVRMWNLVFDKIGGKDVGRLLYQDAKEDLQPQQYSKSFKQCPLQKH